MHDVPPPSLRGATPHRAPGTERSTAPVTTDNAAAEDEEDEDEEMPRTQMTRRRIAFFALFVVSSIALMYFVLPQLVGLDDTWKKIQEGDSLFIFLALLFQIGAMVSYIAIFKGLLVPPDSRITWRESYEITMAGLAATRLFAAGGAGGVALTAWALRRSGMKRRDVAERMIAFLVLQYAIYMLALIVFGIGLRTGVFHGGGSFGVTIVPAIFGGVVLIAGLATAYLPRDLQHRYPRWREGNGRGARWMRRLLAVPESTGGGVRLALDKVRHPDWALAGTLAWWGFNVAILWAAFRAFGDAPPLAVLVMGFFVGMLGNLLPLPGGIGGVDGGMIGAFLAFGEPEGLAIVAVLVYRGFAFWLPTIPGVIAYFQLRHTVNRWRDERAERRATAAAPA